MWLTLAEIFRNELDTQEPPSHTSLASGPLPRMLIYRCSAMGFCGGHGRDLGYIMSVAMKDIKIRWLNVDDVDEIRKSMLFLYTWTVESYLNCNFVLSQAASESLGFFSEPLSWQKVWAGSEHRVGVKYSNFSWWKLCHKKFSHLDNQTFCFLERLRPNAHELQMWILCSLPF